MDPAETEAMRCLEEGTIKLEEGDVHAAKSLYQRSTEIKKSASSLFNLGVTHYHLSKLHRWHDENARDARCLTRCMHPQRNTTMPSPHGKSQ